LAGKIRDFIHDRFQTVTLPRFIKKVSVHSFDFGSIPPEIEIKDICDPLPDFYEENDRDHDNADEEIGEDLGWQPTNTDPVSRDKGKVSNTTASGLLVDTKLPGLRPVMQNPGDLASPFLGVGTPGISGGTSNLNYFHSHLATGLSGTQTPLAAVAGAHLPRGWPDYSALSRNPQRQYRRSTSGSSVSRPSTAESAEDPNLRENDSVSTLAASSTTHRPRTQDELLDDGVFEDSTPPRKFREARVEDLQTVFRVRYSGDVKLSLTAEILLDYPMPSFVGIPLNLNITGFSFDGVAVLAYIRKRVHFCFLSPEDALTAIGADGEQNSGSGLKMGGLLQEIKVESEIGQRENGRQSLKNVGKVEKFVLEQVRRTFEDEFVYPSFWTFLI
jgi:distribution and morphology protein 12